MVRISLHSLPLGSLICFRCILYADVTASLPVSDLRRISKDKEALQFDLEEHRNQTAAMKSKISEFEAEHLKLNKVSRSPSQSVVIPCQ